MTSEEDNRTFLTVLIQATERGRVGDNGNREYRAINARLVSATLMRARACYLSEAEAAGAGLLAVLAEAGGTAGLDLDAPLPFAPSELFESCAGPELCLFA